MKKKKHVVMEFDADSLLDFRKTLFERGITVETFFAHIARRATVRDEIILQLIKEASEERKDALFRQNIMKKKSLDTNTLYALIQDQLKEEIESSSKNTQNNGEQHDSIKQ